METHVERSKTASKSNSIKNHSPTTKSKKKCYCFKKLFTLLCSYLGLYLIVFTYSVIGAFVFNSLESRFEEINVNHVIKIRNETISKLWQMTENLNILREENWTSMARVEILSFQAQLLKAFKQGYDESHSSDQWSLSGAFLYSLTLITSLGEFKNLFLVTCNFAFMQNMKL